MSAEESGRRLREHVLALDDEELVQAAFDAWAAFASEAVTPAVQAMVLKDLEEAEAQLRSQAVLAREGRGRLRRFLLNARLHAVGAKGDGP